MIFTKSKLELRFYWGDRGWENVSGGNIKGLKSSGGKSMDYVKNFKNKGKGI